MRKISFFAPFLYRRILRYISSNAYNSPGIRIRNCMYIDWGTELCQRNSYS